jgi:flavodoxin
MNAQLKAISLTMMTMLISCFNVEAQMSSTNNKILVTYFSHSGNTREIALQIKEATGADVFEIVPVHPYPTNYNAVVAQAEQELKADYRPKLKSAVSNIASYDVIFVGSPNWWSAIAPLVMTFLSSHDFSGKTIVPFITHEGSGLGRSVRDVKRLAPGATVLEGQSFRGHDVKDAQNDVLKWLREIKLLK